jgi:hypothetical protein
MADPVEQFNQHQIDVKSRYNLLEPISKLSEQQNHGGNLHKPEKILRIQLPAIQ